MNYIVSKSYLKKTTYVASLMFCTIISYVLCILIKVYHRKYTPHGNIKNIRQEGMNRNCRYMGGLRYINPIANTKMEDIS